MTPGNHLRQRHEYKWYNLKMNNHYCVSAILLLENLLIDLATSCMQITPSASTYKNILTNMEKHTLYHKLHTKSKQYLDNITTRLVSMMPITLTTSLLYFPHTYITSLNINILLIMIFIRLFNYSTQ